MTVTLKLLKTTRHVCRKPRNTVTMIFYWRAHRNNKASPLLSTMSFSWKKYYIFGRKIVYYFQIYLKMNYFPPIIVNEIQNFILIVLFQSVKCDLPCCCAVRREKFFIHLHDTYTKNIIWRLVVASYIIWNTGNLYYSYILCWFFSHSGFCQFASRIWNYSRSYNPAMSYIFHPTLRWKFVILIYFIKM